jgi:murein L,D-transpeptidase YcbB/YkuD
MLYAIENGELEFTQKIVVGKVKRKTPVFQSYITRVIFNPSWTVPPTIFFEDKLPRIRRDPSYLKRANYIVRNSKGVIVDPRKVNWKAVSRNRMSYSIRKLPGSDNPLGQIKFEIANSNGIFMHGTSQENLFNSESRPFSSGCVRVEDPIELAAWVLNEDKDYIKDRIDREKTASLQSDAFPIIFSYITLWVDDLNEVFISEDPYDKF